jgi:nicotinamidase-related amidase
MYVIILETLDVVAVAVDHSVDATAEDALQRELKRLARAGRNIRQVLWRNE